MVANHRRELMAHMGALYVVLDSNETLEYMRVKF